MMKKSLFTVKIHAARPIFLRVYLHRTESNRQSGERTEQGVSNLKIRPLILRRKIRQTRKKLTVLRWNFSGKTVNFPRYRNTVRRRTINGKISGLRAIDGHPVRILNPRLRENSVLILRKKRRN